MVINNENLPKIVCGVNVVLFKIPAAFFNRDRKIIPKMYMKPTKGPKLPKQSSKKNCEKKKVEVRRTK